MSNNHPKSRMFFDGELDLSRSLLSNAPYCHVPVGYSSTLDSDKDARGRDIPVLYTNITTG